MKMKDEHLFELDNEEFVIISKDKNDILDELDFKDETERALCDSIITNNEKLIAENLRSMKVVQIPYIGNMRVNPVQRKMRDNYKNFKIARRNMTKEQYKEHVRSYFIEAKQNQDYLDKLKLVRRRNKINNKAKYELLIEKLGKSYAEMYIFAIYLLEYIPFDEEWEERYQELKNQ